MSLKTVDTEYLRTQGAAPGQVLLAGESNTVTYTQYLNVDSNGNVGIGTIATDQRVTIYGNITVAGTVTATEVVSNSIPLPIGEPGSVQYVGLDGQTATDALHLVYDYDNYRLGIGTSLPVSTLQVNHLSIESTLTTCNDTNVVLLDSFLNSKVRSAHYFIQVTDDDMTQYHTTQISVVQDGVTAYKTEYGLVTSADRLGVFDCIINNNEMQLIFTAFEATNKTIKTTRTGITA